MTVLEPGHTENSGIAASNAVSSYVLHAVSRIQCAMSSFLCMNARAINAGAEQHWRGHVQSLAGTSDAGVFGAFENSHDVHLSGPIAVVRKTSN